MPTIRLHNRFAGDANGAAALDRIGEESYRLDAENERRDKEAREQAHQNVMEEYNRRREERIQKMEEAHQKVADAIEQRKSDEAVAKADKRKDAEDRIPKALGELSNIDPSSPKAHQAVADVKARYWQLVGHGRDNMPSLDSHLAEKIKEIERYEKAHPDLTPPTGTHLKTVGPTGPTFEPDATKEEKAAIAKAKAEAAVTAKRDREIFSRTALRDRAAREMGEMTKMPPAWMNSTGAMKTADGTMRFGFKNKPFDSSSPEATDDQIEQWKRYQELKAEHDEHDEALQGLHKAQLAALIAPPPEATPNQTAPPAPSQITAPPANPNVPTAPVAPTATPPAGTVTDANPPEPQKKTLPPLTSFFPAPTQ